MKVPHPSEVILNGRLRTQSDGVQAIMLRDFLDLSEHQKTEFLFWLTRDQFELIENLRRQIETMTRMVQQASGSIADHSSQR